MSPAERVLIDTSAWVEALRSDGDPATAEVVVEILTGDRAALCDLVLLELWNGARGDEERRTLRDLERNVPVLPSPAEVWASARDLARRCRDGGTTAPSTDLLIAACARHHGVRLLHRDGHFDRVDEAAGPA